MEVLKIIAIVYLIVLTCVFLYGILGNYLTIRKYGKEIFYKFSPCGYKFHLFMGIIWPLLLMFGLFILFQKFFGEYK